MRWLSATVRSLWADRDRLLARVTVLERNIHEVTGSIERENARGANPAPAAAAAARCRCCCRCSSRPRACSHPAAAAAPPHLRLPRRQDLPRDRALPRPLPLRRLGGRDRCWIGVAWTIAKSQLSGRQNRRRHRAILALISAAGLISAPCMACGLRPEPSIRICWMACGRSSVSVKAPSRAGLSCGWWPDRLPMPPPPPDFARRSQRAAGPAGAVRTAKSCCNSRSRACCRLRAGAA